jgi:hypothetical protein
MQLGKYKHYKGKHSETKEDLVVYKALYDDLELGKEPLFVRPKVMFVENVLVEGRKVARFKKI